MENNSKNEDGNKKSDSTVIGSGTGLCLGVVFGIIFDNLALGIAIGLCLGGGIGRVVDVKKKK